MNAETRRRIVEALDHCRNARNELGAEGTHRTRVLLDMTVQALSQELAVLDARTAARPADVGATG